MEYKLRRGLRKAWEVLRKGCLVLLVLFLTGGSLYAGLDPQDSRIHAGVHIGGMDLGGMTTQEAYHALKSASETILEGMDLTVQLPEETILLSPADSGAKLRTCRAVLAAFRAGRFTENKDIPLLPYLKLDTDTLTQILADYAARHDTDVTASCYSLTGTMPELEAEDQTGDGVCQTLELTMGLPTARLDQDGALAAILQVYDTAFAAAEAGAYRTDDFRVDILEEPEMPDLQAIYEEFYVAPVDDRLDMEAYCVIPGAYGYGFDPDFAEKLTKIAAYGQTLKIPMELLEPEIFGDDVYYTDLLGYCETPHTKDENRNHNLTLACQSMDGLVLQPGDVFSYNDTLGQRTKERGYKRAGAYSGWELVMSYGGGICQGSSTIYCAALYADLEIVHRRNHGYAVGYIDPGLDATVNWGGPDFQFRNSTHFPIRIDAEVSDGYVKVAIMGTEERDYYVEMESEAVWGEETVYAKSYKCKYDRETNELISRELEARSNYMR